MAVEEQCNQGPPVFPANGSAPLWMLYRRRLLSMVLGILLAILIHLGQSLFPSTNMAGGLITWHPEIAIILFCGVVSGPLTGLVVGGFSSLGEDLLSYHTSFWNWELSYALIGFLAGLSLLVTTRRSRALQNMLFVELISLIAVVIGLGLAACSDIWVLGIDLPAAAGELLFAGTSDLVNGLLLLTLLVLVYRTGRRIRIRGRWSHRK